MGILQEIAQQVQDDITNNQQWFDRECSCVIDGSHNSGRLVYDYLIDTLDINKPKYGKRGANAIAFVGNTILQDIYSINSNQAYSVWKHLSKEHKVKFDEIVKDFLSDFNDEMMEA